MNPIELARLAAGILNMANIDEGNIRKANKILELSLVEIERLALQASLGSAGIVTST